MEMPNILSFLKTSSVLYILFLFQFSGLLKKLDNIFFYSSFFLFLQFRLSIVTYSRIILDYLESQTFQQNLDGVSKCTMLERKDLFTQLPTHLPLPCC